MFTNFKTTEVDAEHTLVTGTCIVTRKPVTLTVRTQSLNDYYVHGKKAQDAFPDLSAAQREYFISGCSPEGWNELFPPDEN